MTKRGDVYVFHQGLTNKQFECFRVALAKHYPDFDPAARLVVISKNSVMVQIKMLFHKPLPNNIEDTVRAVLTTVLAEKSAAQITAELVAERTDSFEWMRPRAAYERR